MHSTGGRQPVCSWGWGLWAVRPGRGCGGGSTTYSHKSCWAAGKEAGSFYDNKYTGAEFVAHIERSSLVCMTGKCSGKWFIIQTCFCRVFRLLLEACTVLHLLPTTKFGQLVSMTRVHWVALQVMSQNLQWPLAGKLCSD